MRIYGWWGRNGHFWALLGPCLRFSSLAQYKLFGIYLTGFTNQLIAQNFSLFWRRAQSWLLRGFLVTFWWKMAKFEVFHHYLTIIDPTAHFKAWNHLIIWKCNSFKRFHPHIWNFDFSIIEKWAKMGILGGSFAKFEVFCPYFSISDLTAHFKPWNR